MNPETKNKLSYKLSTASIVLIPIAIGINYLGKYIAGVLRLPLWLDSIGTVLSGMLAGPVIGAASGIINNVIYGVTADFDSVRDHQRSHRFDGGSVCR